jgi:hypothetical protein
VAVPGRLKMPKIFIIATEFDGSSVKWVTREEWGWATNPAGSAEVVPENTTFDGIVIHNTEFSKDGSIIDVQNEHIAKWWGIGYHYVISKQVINDPVVGPFSEWKVFEARPLDRVGAHAGKGFNRWSIGIAVQGDYSQFVHSGEDGHANGYLANAFDNERQPDKEALQQLGHLLDYIEKNVTGGTLPLIYSHGQGDEKRPTDTKELAINPGHTDCPGDAFVPHVRWFREKHRDVNATPIPDPLPVPADNTDACNMELEVAEALGFDQEYCWSECGIDPNSNACACEEGDEYSCYESCIEDVNSLACQCDLGELTGDDAEEYCQDPCLWNPNGPGCVDPCETDPESCNQICRFTENDGDIEKTAGENFIYKTKADGCGIEAEIRYVSYVNGATGETVDISAGLWPFETYSVGWDLVGKLGFTNPTSYSSGQYRVELHAYPDDQTYQLAVVDNHTFNVTINPESLPAGGHEGDGDPTSQQCVIVSHSGSLAALEWDSVLHQVLLSGDCQFASFHYRRNGQPIFNSPQFHFAQTGSHQWALLLPSASKSQSGQYSVFLRDAVIFTDEQFFTINIEGEEDPCEWDMSVECGTCDDFNDNNICDDEEVESDADSDLDEDGLTYSEEIDNGTDPINHDTDGDELTDGEEVNEWGTDPLNPDSDGDGVTDGEEVYNYGSDPWEVDTDADGLSDGQEVNEYRTDPTNDDSDGDGLSDFREIEFGTDPTNDDSDSDGDPDGTDPAPNDGTTNSWEMSVDTDGDGIDNGDEDDGSECGFYSDSSLYDSDGDGLSDGEECWYSDPMKVDSDGDGVSDFDEYYSNTDALDSEDF